MTCYMEYSQGKQPKVRNCDQVSHNKTLQFSIIILQTSFLNLITSPAM